MANIINSTLKHSTFRCYGNESKLSLYPKSAIRHHSNTTERIVAYALAFTINYVWGGWALKLHTCILLSKKLIHITIKLICILFNPIPILTPIPSRKKIRLRQPNFSLYSRESFFLYDAVSSKSVWPHMYRLTTIWDTKTRHWQAKLAICTPVCKSLDLPLEVLSLENQFAYATWRGGWGCFGYCCYRTCERIG